MELITLVVATAKAILWICGAVIMLAFTLSVLRAG